MIVVQQRPPYFFILLKNPNLRKNDIPSRGGGLYFCLHDSTETQWPSLFMFFSRRTVPVPSSLCLFFLLISNPRKKKRQFPPKRTRDMGLLTPPLFLSYSIEKKGGVNIVDFFPYANLACMCEKHIVLVLSYNWSYYPPPPPFLIFWSKISEV